MESFIWVVPLAPLVGSIINAFFGHILKEKSGYVAVAAMVIAFIFSVRAFLHVLGGEIYDAELYAWIAAGDFHAGAGLLIDQLSSIMMLVVTGVGTLIHIYSMGYMHGDKAVGRYFCYLNLFVFSMLMLVMGNNLLLLYLGWEGVGLCSYLLIGFWYEKEYAAKAGLKAFITNRIGDFGFAIGIFIIFNVLGTITYTEIFADLDPLVQQGWVTTVCLLLFMGAMGKSAQFPLYVWLPDAMAGPTPVSALIHAATMVTAGVYMVARFSALFALSAEAMLLITVIGTFTALFAASMALVNTDIKKILAYSTISQLGYMFIGVGVGAYAAGIFHLMTHAFFKALLFLGAGAVMHALSDETNIEKMGALKDKIRITFATFFLAWLAICGVPPFSGFFSKDEILAKAFLFSPVIWLLGVVGAFLTAFYMSRLVFLTFYGDSRVDPEVESHIHESPKVMTVPLMILAFLAVVGGLFGIPDWISNAWGGSNYFEHFLHPVFAAASESPAMEHLTHHPSVGLEIALMLTSILVAVSGIFLAHRMYVTKTISADALAEKYSGIYQLLYNKYHVDEIIDKTIINPIIGFSRWLWNFFDSRVIDGFVNLCGKMAILISLVLRRLQTGYVQNYASIMVIGVLLVLAFYLFS